MAMGTRVRNPSMIYTSATAALVASSSGRRLLSTDVQAAMPHTPLLAYKEFLAAGPSLRTGYTNFFSRRSGVDRSDAAKFRQRCRSGAFTDQTSGSVPGFVQANLVALPQEHAFDFLRFCLANPRACPLLDVTAPGDPAPRTVAADADLRTDIPKYWVWRDGQVAEERTDVSDLWSDGMVGFLLGCSFSWEHLLHEHYLTPRQIEERCNVPMYRTNVPNVAVGPFGGNLVVSMRPYLPSQLSTVAALTGRYPGAHGGPVHWGDAGEIGVNVQGPPDWGDQVTIREGEVPAFWACGVTPQEALRQAKLPLAITHAPGHMFVSDLTDSEIHVPNLLEDATQSVEIRACRACTSRRTRVQYPTPWKPPSTRRNRNRAKE
jgi:uncharacterized protein YcsI (UPF0317 family)